MKEGVIGIVGGMGPLAGISLSEKIVTQTIAGKDQEHISQILFSAPRLIEDRTEFILGKTDINPAIAIAEIILSLQSMGATVVGLPCNSAHAPVVYDVIVEKLKEANATIKLLHMIEETGRFIGTQFTEVRKAGILGTMGTFQSRQYNLIEGFGVEAVNLSAGEAEKVHQAIYHPDYGIKSNTEEISEKSLEILHAACNSLIGKGAEVIILGCTELPLAIKGKFFGTTPLVDSTLVLARALIAAVDVDKLKSW